MPDRLYILHVEDDADDAELLQDAFKDNGISVCIEVVTTGDKVMPLLTQGTRLPDVIVMDLNLPKIHGKDVLKALKANEKLKSIPVVILTTSSSADDKAYCIQNGADKFITKPYTAEGFTLTISLITSVVPVWP